jgi:excisionase family DNA binding protein
MPEVMTTKEAAEYLRTTTDTVKRLARNGALPSAKLGRGWRFRKPDLDEWLRNGGTRQEELVDQGLVRAVKERMATTRREEGVPWEQVKAELEALP